MEPGSGFLVLVGGAEERDGDMTILSRIHELAGGSEARMVVLATASREASETAERYREAFSSLGPASVATLAANDRAKVSSASAVCLLEHASGAFFTGGDQLRITSLVGGTPFERALRGVRDRGGVVAGTSAGASALGDFMIIEGAGNDCPRKCTIKLAPGLGFLPDCIVDQHFSQRGRMGRLLAAIAQNPRMLGFGIDEDAALVVGPGDVVEVIGSAAVTVVDGRKMDHVNVSEQEQDRPLALTNVRVHVLPAGYRFDLQTLSPSDFGPT